MRDFIIAYTLVCVCSAFMCYHEGRLDGLDKVKEAHRLAEYCARPGAIEALCQPVIGE